MVTVSVVKSCGYVRRQIFLTFALLAVTAARAEDPFAWDSVEDLPTISPRSARGLRLVGQIGSSEIEGLCWSQDGRYLGLRSSSGVAIHKLESQQPVRLSKVGVVATDRAPSSSSFGKLAEALATCDGGPEITLWNPASGERIRVMNAGMGVNALAFSPIGHQLAAITADGKLRLWRDEALAEPPLIIDDHERAAAGVSIDGKGKWAVTWAGQDDVHVWDIATGKRVVQVTTRKGRVGSQLDVAFVAPDDSLWVGVPGKTLHWSLPSGEPLPSHETALFLGPGCFSVDRTSCLVRIGAGDFGKGSASCRYQAAANRNRWSLTLKGWPLAPSNPRRAR